MRFVCERIAAIKGRTTPGRSRPSPRQCPADVRPAVRTPDGSSARSRCLRAYRSTAPSQARCSAPVRRGLRYTLRRILRMELRPSFVAACSFLRRALRRCCPLLLAQGCLRSASGFALPRCVPPPVGRRAPVLTALFRCRALSRFSFYSPAPPALLCSCLRRLILSLFLLASVPAPLRHVPAALPRSCLLSARSLFRAAALACCPPVPAGAEPPIRPPARLLGLPECCRCRLP